MKKYNFKDILEKEITIDEQANQQQTIAFDKIEIPMIQRDYAQGREDTKEVRERFLKAIFEALDCAEDKELDIDFVYGSVASGLLKESKENVFTILDGQQRLTTLFLLHWYIGSRERSDTKKINLDFLKKFTYATRASSRTFCEELVNEASLTFNETPKEEITNLPWFFKTYEKDPTIKSMLTMLDAIHGHYEKSQFRPLFKKLDNIQFYILPLEGFDLSDELYVKMNARGKELTNFENFKADLIKWMKNDENPDKDAFHEKTQYPEKKEFKSPEEMPYYYEVISQKIDNEWTDIFWNITKDYDVEAKDESGNLKYPDGKIVDHLFMRLIYRYFLNRYILCSTASNETIEKEPDFNFFAKPDTFQSFDVFAKHLDFKEIEAFEKIFDVLAKNWDEIYEVNSPSWSTAETCFFLGDDIFQPQRVVLLGITLYFEKNDSFDPIPFKQWMRTVWNIVENTDISDWSSAIGVMKLLSELSANASSIYQYLADLDISKMISESSKVARDEEKWKCSFMWRNKSFCREWEKAFVEAEKHEFFKGSVSFLMTEDMQIGDFKHRTEMAEKVFDANGVVAEYRKNGHLFLRALISRYEKYSQIFKDKDKNKKNFTDTSEREKYLKKMLASDDVVKEAIREWFSLENENILKDKLNEAVKKDSSIICDISAEHTKDISSQRWLKKVHEDLYKEPDLQDWIQQWKAIRVGWFDEELYTSKTGAWYDWMLLGSYRNEIITKLLELPRTKLLELLKSSSTPQCHILENNPIPYYRGKEGIHLSREMDINGELVLFKYSFFKEYIFVGIADTPEWREKFGKIDFTEATEKYDYREKEEDWICRKVYNYQDIVTSKDKIKDFIKEIEKDIFSEENSLASCFKEIICRALENTQAGQPI